MKIGVSVREAAWLLSRSESQIRRLIGAGLLSYAVRPRLLDPGSVAALFPVDASYELRETALALLLAGRVRAPAVASRYAKPEPLTMLPLLLQKQLAERECSIR